MHSIFISINKKVIFILSLCLISFSIEASTAPDFSLPSDKDQIQLSTFKGEVVYLDFWASWCGPCRKSFPWMNAMHNKYKAQGLRIITINLDKNRKDAQKFLDRYPAEFIVAYDPKGKSAEKYQVMGMPSSYFIDREGEIKIQHKGFRDKDRGKLEETIKLLLEQ